MAVGNEIKNRARAEFEGNLGTTEPVADEVTLARAAQIYTVNCAPCHRADGGGLVGPNLTDDYWIHGPTFADNLKVIWNGVPEKGMVSWKGLLKPDEIKAVASYIHTLRGAELETPGKLPENQQPVDTGPSIYE
jgi:cytochrome c oxidase cbb3-type subunit 3